MKHNIITLIVAAVASIFATKASGDVNSVQQEWKDSVRAAMKYVVEQKMICQDRDTMPLWWHIYGEEPKDGRSLWISLHGGGGAPPKVNDGQWDNQKKLYTPKEGVYVAPRAPWDAWNMWFMNPIDGMYEQLIRTMVAYYNVNPDKVYIMGYSAGGDGVWRLAPRMADYWAATSMMAGHPGDVSLVNVRNTPFMIWMGENDTAYDRCYLAPKRGAELDSLQKEDAGGYIHETHIVPECGHWMLRKDTVALDWMAKYTRNPYPKKIVWQQEERLRSCFYWIEAPEDELQRGKRVEATVLENTIDIKRCDYSHLTLYLSDSLVQSLKSNITVLIEGKKVFHGKVKCSEQTMRNTLYKRQDLRYACPAILDVKRGR